MFGVIKLSKISCHIDEKLIMNINVRSLKKNLDSLESLVLGLESPPAIICITETWLNENDDPKTFLIHGYNQEITKSRTTRGGGVMINS